MKNLRFTNSLAVRSMRVTALASAAAAVAVAAGTLAGAGNAAPARTAGKAAHAQKKQIEQPTLENGLLTVAGTNKADRIALGLQAGQPGIVQVDFGDDGSAEFSFERSQIAEIVVDAGNGGDSVRIDENNGVFSDTIPTTPSSPTTTMAPMFCSARPASSSRTVASGLIVVTAAPLFRKTSAIRIKAPPAGVIRFTPGYG